MTKPDHPVHHRKVTATNPCTYWKVLLLDGPFHLLLQHGFRQICLVMISATWGCFPAWSEQQDRAPNFRSITCSMFCLVFHWFWYTITIWRFVKRVKACTLYFLCGRVCLCAMWLLFTRQQRKSVQKKRYSLWFIQSLNEHWFWWTTHCPLKKASTSWSK